MMFNNSIKHFRLSNKGFNQNASNINISFSGTKDVISINSNSFLLSSNSSATLTRLNVVIDGVNYDYYHLSITQKNRVLFKSSSTTMNFYVLVQDSSATTEDNEQSIYGGSFNRDIVETKIRELNAMSIAFVSLDAMIGDFMPNFIADNLKSVGLEKLSDFTTNSTLGYKSFGNEVYINEINYILKMTLMEE